MKHDDFEAAAPVREARDSCADHREGERTYKVGRVPLCLSTVQGSLVELEFQDVLQDREEEGTRHVLSVVTAEATRRWDLRDV